MATQNGPVIWEKTFDCGVSFYKRLGRGCVRMKSNLTGERWRKDPAFAGSRLSAACMALGSQLGSAVYQTIPLQHRRYPQYKELVGIAQKTLRQGYNIQQVKKVLHFAVARYLRKLQASDPNRKPERSPFAATKSLKTKPVFTTAMPHQLAVPHFNNIIIVDQSPYRLWPVIIRNGRCALPWQLWPLIMLPRGSPTFTEGGSHHRNLSQPPLLSPIRQHSYRNQLFKMAGVVMSISTSLPPLLLKQAANRPAKHQEFFP